MRYLTRIAMTVMLAFAPGSAYATLNVGAPAPPFTLDAALAGKAIKFTLADALAKGPVVVYFYPKSFTKVCTQEAHLFSEAMSDFHELGASVIGISTDDMETQRAFSATECRDEFPVAADTSGAVAKAYDTAFSHGKNVMALRTTYVITPDGLIGTALSASDAETHVNSALEFVRAWRDANSKSAAGSAGAAEPPKEN